MRIELVRKGLPPMSVNFLGCVHDHTELEVPDEDAMEFFSKAAGARQGQVGRKPTLVIG